VGVLCTGKWGMLKISKKLLALEVTEEQKETIYHLFSHNNWGFNEIEIKVNENNVTGEINQTGTPEHF
jgi:hypothetical protein